MDFIEVPNEININDIVMNGFSFSPLHYKGVIIKNQNKFLLKNLLSRNLTFNDKGMEVGSQAYISQSPYYFMRNKALQVESFLPTFVTDSCVPILPNSFRNYDLKEGDILIAKDSNIGEVIILDKDYPNYMFSGGIYRLPIEKNKYYILGFLKSDFFKSQLDLKVPKGVTIRHAKTLFLDCYIPFPNQKNKDDIIKYFEILTKSLINKEIILRQKNKEIFKLITIELNNNQKNVSFQYSYPTLNEIQDNLRIDTGLYCYNYKKLDFLINNYTNGFKTIVDLGYKIERGQNLQVSAIGKSTYSDEYINDFYKLILSSNISNEMTIKKISYLGNHKKLKELKVGDIIFSCRGAQFGRLTVLCNALEKAITNIDNVQLSNSNSELYEKIFVAQILNYYRKSGHLHKIAIVGSGANSLTQYQFELLKIPNFSKSKKIQIANLYFNQNYAKDTKKLNINNFLENDSNSNEMAGIVQLNGEMQLIKKHIDYIINQISNDEEVIIDFDFLNR